MFTANSQNTKWISLTHVMQNALFLFLLKHQRFPDIFSGRANGIFTYKHTFDLDHMPTTIWQEVFSFYNFHENQDRVRWIFQTKNNDWYVRLFPHHDKLDLSMQLKYVLLLDVFLLCLLDQHYPTMHFEMPSYYFSGSEIWLCRFYTQIMTASRTNSRG